VFNGNVPIAFRSEKSSVGKSFNQRTMEGRWKRGVKIYHDDYGYGYIMATDDSGDEYLISVQFESGMVKRFMPRYQSNRLTIIND
jgi:DNA helicase-2/ATP-dependent DNA helicase PcrA